MKPVLEVKHISTSYKEGKQKQKVLEDVNFTLYENEILGLVGESGCGKTTLSKAILGFIKPEEGVHTADCQIHVNVQSKEAGEFHLCS